jgi:hypothetical protein
MVFQPGQQNAPWPAQGKLYIDNGGPQHTTLQVISGQVTLSGGTATILSSAITATSQFLFTIASGSGAPLAVNTLIAGAGAVLTGTGAGTYNYVIIG